MSVERGIYDDGARYSNVQITVVRARTRALEAFFRRFSSELDGVLDVFLIGLIEGARFDRVLDRENRMALVHLSIVDDAHHGFELAFRNVKDAPHVVLHVFAGDGMGWKGRGRRRDGAVRRG